MNDTIEQYLTRRAAWVVRKILPNWGVDANVTTKFYIAGGCLRGTIRDVDIFPACETPIVAPKVSVVLKTKNAITYATEPWVLQICNYRHRSLEELVESFDFSHIQAGCLVKINEDFVSVTEAYCSEAWVTSNAIGTTTYTGSEYPLSSLIRCQKYYPRQIPSRGAYIGLLLECLADVLKRGFKDYEDFKDQFDAVDLGVVPENLENLTQESLQVLFNMLEKPTP